MKLIINGAAYVCTGRPSFTDPVRFCLPGDKPDVTALGNTLSLRTDEGDILRDVDISAMTARRYFDGDWLTITNIPEPEPVTPPAPTPTLDDRVTTLETAFTALKEATT
jgi:hypothetical protein